MNYTVGFFNMETEPGTNDIAIVAVNALDTSLKVLAVKILRSQTVPGVVNDGQTVVLTPNDEPTSQTIAVTNILPGFTSSVPTAAYRTVNGTSFPVTSAPPYEYAVIPASEAQSGDTYQFSATGFALQPAPSSGAQFVTSVLSTSGAGAVTLSLPAPLAYSEPIPDPFPSFDLAYSRFTRDSEVNYSVALTWLAAGSFNNLVVIATAAYQNGTTTLTVPDLTGLTGFLAAPSSGAMVSWSASVSGHTSKPTESLAVVINEGSYNEP